MKTQTGIIFLACVLLSACNATMGTSASVGGRDGGVRVGTTTNAQGQTRARVGVGAVLKRWKHGNIRVGGSTGL